MEGLRRTFSHFSARFYATILLVGMIGSSHSVAEEAQWIWNHGIDIQTEIATGETCYFREPINLKIRSIGRVEIAADDQFELFVNGKPVGKGQSSRELQQFDISEQLEVGRNVIAVKVVNTHGTTAALAARVSIKPEKQPKWFTFSSSAAFS